MSAQMRKTIHKDYSKSQYIKRCCQVRCYIGSTIKGKRRRVLGMEKKCAF